jgi:nicotinamidase-related amidase
MPRARILLPPTDPQVAFPSRRELARRVDRASSLLLVVDIQERLALHVAGHEALIERTQALLSAAARLEVPRLATEHCAGQIGPLVPAIASMLEPRETFSKSHFGATDHPEFRALLARSARTQIVVAGVEAHVCVMQTALGLAGLHYEVIVVGDAVGSRAERQADRQFALLRLRDAGCTIVGTETVLFEWTGSGDDAAFRDVLKIVKGLPAS